MPSDSEYESECKSELEREPKSEPAIDCRRASTSDLTALLSIEQACFSGDRLSRRSFKRFLNNQQAVFLVADCAGQLGGYILVLFHRGTRLARLYSIAVSPEHRGLGIAAKLMQDAERQAVENGALFLRLEVSQSNANAISLYRKYGYREFGKIKDYYEDHSDALRMQKVIRQPDSSSVHLPVKWYRQTTNFTCGPSALMMAMSAVNTQSTMSMAEELQLWREATTIFMTSGHGGTHPLGLAVAASKRGYSAQVWLSEHGPLFVDGVRQADKKAVIEMVHQEFVTAANQNGVGVNYRSITQSELEQACDEGACAMLLISTYRLDSRKAPHWVTISGYDARCFYVHDPDPSEQQQDGLDCQFLPIAREDIDKMSQFGSRRLRAAIILQRAHAN